MNSIVTIEPTVEPITVLEAKKQLNVDAAFTDDDTFISACIIAARTWLEKRTQQSFLTQTRIQYMDRFPLGEKITLINGPVISLTHIKYYDSADVQQTWLSTSYWFDNKAFSPQVIAKYSWPSIGDRPSGIEITTINGFGATASFVPNTIQSCMRLLVSHLYNNRIQEVESTTRGGGFAKLEMGIETLLCFDTRLNYTGYADRY